MIKSSLWFGVYSVVIFRIIRETPNIDIWVMWRALGCVCRYNAHTWSFVSPHMCPQSPVITAGVLYKRWGNIKKRNLQMIATSERLSGGELFINQSRAPRSTKPNVRKGLLLWISSASLLHNFVEIRKTQKLVNDRSFGWSIPLSYRKTKFMSYILNRFNVRNC